MPQPKKIPVPRLLVSDGIGRVFEIEEYEALGMRLRIPFRPEPEEWIPMPEGSVLMELPGRIPLARDSVHGEFIPVPSFRGKPVTAVSAFVAPAHTQLYTAAYQTMPNSKTLPLFAYTPVGWKEGRFWVTAVRVDDDVRHDPSRFKASLLEKAAERMAARYPGNRLVTHLVDNCVRRYACPNAQNFVLERWECPVPVSPECSASCLGCISKQPENGVPSTQNRIAFVPAPEEIAEMAVPHLRHADKAMVSFGQGCEGEPLTRYDLIEKSIRLMRAETLRGTIHLNTNAGRPQVLESLFRAGLDSLRVSMNSAQPPFYDRYFRPRAYGFSDVLESLKIAGNHGAYVSLNYFIFPGWTDRPDEMEALFGLLEKYKIDCIQARNLNIDPEFYVRKMILEKAPLARRSIGILEWMERVRQRKPGIQIRYFNPPKEDWNRGIG
jgi:pyruvate-formate lyase-activating enzyme